MAKGKKVEAGEYAWFSPEVVQREFAQSDDPDVLRGALANPSQGEYRTPTGALVQRHVVTEDGDCDFHLYEGDASNYEHTVAYE